MSDLRKPLLMELDDTDAESPADAPPVPDQIVAAPATSFTRFATQKPSLLGRVFWSALGLLLSITVVNWAWELVTSLLLEDSWLGYLITGLLLLVLLILLIWSIRELAGFARLRRLDRLRANAETALTHNDPAAARQAANAIDALYADRGELAWARENHAAAVKDQVDADAVLVVTEQTLLAPLDDAARHEVEAATRQVALATALVPLALVDLLAALLANLRMIRRIAEIYGGRTGRLGSWRLTRAVLTHLAATGAVAVGDDLIGSVAGGSVLSKFSRRFGEGVVNGALTARVGLAAMDVCRPLPFIQAQRPKVTTVLKNALTGLFASGSKSAEPRENN